MAFEREQKILKKEAEAIEELETFIYHHGKKLEHLTEGKFRVVISVYGSRIIIDDLSDLSEARRILREIFGTWKDELDQIWTSCSMVIVAWKSPDNDLFSIWLETTAENFPPELKGDNCSFVPRTTVEQVLVCKS